MSNRHSVLCIPCLEEAPHLSLNWGREELQKLIDTMPVLLIAYDHSDGWAVEVDVRCAGQYVPLDWFRKHEKHELRVREEYEDY